MRMPARLELPRGFFVTVVAAGVGSMLGGLAIFGHPLAGTTLAPFTLFGALVVLLPTYLWAKDTHGWSRRACYLAVLVAGALGGFLILFILFTMMGGLAAAASLKLLELLLMGSVFGTTTATCWVTSHYLTRSKWVGDLET